MKQVPVLFLLFTLGIQNVYSRNHDDSTSSVKTGWLVYWHDKIIWIEARVSKNVEDQVFFQSQKEYKNGLNVKQSYDAAFYKSIARGHLISYYHNDSIDVETDPKFLDSIWILPVKVKYKMGLEAAPETMRLRVIKYKQETLIEYKGVASYSIIDMELLRKKDKRRLRRVKEYVGPSLH